MFLVIPFPHFDPIAFHFGPIQIHWYALMYVVAFIAGYLLMKQRLKHEPYRSITIPKPWTKENIDDILLFAMLGVIICGRLGYCLFYQPKFYLSHPWKILTIWEGGMSFHGGAIGVILAMIYVSKITKHPWLQITDLLAPAVPIGLFAGRIGNFINGELWGRQAPDNLPWAMVFPSGGSIPRHPSQLYQALGEGLLLFSLLWLYARKPRLRGEVSSAFLVGYGLFRFGAEYFREPDSFLGYLSLGLTMGQWLCIPMIIVGIGLWLWSRNRDISDLEDNSSSNTNPEITEAEPVSSETSDTKENTSQESSAENPSLADGT